MPACEPTLLTSSACLTCLTEHQLLAVIACQAAVANGMSCDPAILMAQAKCLTCLTEQQLLAIIACNGVSGGTGSGFSVAHGDEAPPTDGSVTDPCYVNDTTHFVYLNIGTVLNPTWQPV